MTRSRRLSLAEAAAPVPVAVVEPVAVPLLEEVQVAEAGCEGGVLVRHIENVLGRCWVTIGAKFMLCTNARSPRATGTRSRSTA